MRCTTVPRWRETGYREGGCAQRKVESPRCPRWRAGTCPRAGSLEGCGIWHMVHMLVLRRGSIVASVVAYCVAHEISTPPADWRLNVQQIERTWIFFRMHSLTHPPSGKCRRAVLDARACETNFGRRAGSASQRPRRRSRKGRRKTRSESLIVGSGQWDRLWSFFCLELLKMRRRGTHSRGKIYCGTRIRNVKDPSPAPANMKGTGQVLASDVLTCSGCRWCWVLRAGCVSMSMSVSVCFRERRESDMCSRGCPDYALCVWRAATTESMNRSKVID